MVNMFSSDRFRFTARKKASIPEARRYSKSSDEWQMNDSVIASSKTPSLSIFSTRIGIAGVAGTLAMQPHIQGGANEVHLSNTLRLPEFSL